MSSLGNPTETSNQSVCKPRTTEYVLTTERPNQTAYLTNIRRESKQTNPGRQTCFDVLAERFTNNIENKEADEGEDDPSTKKNSSPKHVDLMLQGYFELKLCGASILSLQTSF